MSGQLNIELQIVEEKANIILEGIIDEDSDFEKVKGLNQSEYIFDFEKITSINSCGIRDWIKFLDELPEDVQILYKNCPQIIIEQMNMVHGFIRKGARIESLYCPYYCEDCDTESKIHVETKNLNGAMAPAGVKCPNCGSENMEFDAIEEQYFNFMKQG